MDSLRFRQNLSPKVGDLEVGRQTKFLHFSPGSENPAVSDHGNEEDWSHHRTLLLELSNIGAFPSKTMGTEL
jgi:hypothetical protein